MGIQDWIDSIDRNYNRNRALGTPGPIAGGLGDLGGWAVEQITRVVPGALGGALRQGVIDANLGNLMGEMFANLPLAGMQKKLIDTLKGFGDEIGQEWGKADQAASAYAKKIGLAADQMARLRDEMIRVGNASKLSANYNKSLEELIQLQSNYANAVGRSIRLTNVQFESLTALSAVVGDDMAVQFSNSLENFGLSATDAGERMTQMFNRSSKQGLSLEKYAKNVTDHLSMAQRYSFKRGVDGLTAMAEKAAKLRVDMDMVASLADNLNNIEKSVNVSAQLQVLGGPFTQFADPMGLLHDSLNDVEGLQDRLTNLTNSLGHFNRQTNQIEINNFDRIRLREAASAMGVDYSKLIDQTTTQARRNEIDYQMRGLTNIPDEYKELLRNIGTFENGVAGAVGVDGEFKSLANLDGNDLKTLADYSKTDSENISDIAQMLRGYFDVQQGTEKQIATTKAQKFEKEAISVKGVYDAIGQNAQAINKLIMIELTSKWMTPLASSVMGKVGGAARRTIAARMGHSKGGMIITHDEGGYISNGDGNREMILNSAQHGEFVINRASTMNYLPLLQLLNGDTSGRLLNTFGGGMNMNPMMGMFVTEMGKQDKTMRDIGKWMRRSEMSTMEQIKLIERWGRINKPDSTMTKTLSKFTNNLNKFTGAASKIANVGVPVIAGVAAGVSSYRGYKSKGDDFMNRGKAVGGTIGATVGAVAASSLLSLIPVVGPILGATVGPMIGSAVGKAAGEAIGKGNQARRIRKNNEILSEMTNEEGSAKFATLKGSFSVREQKKIAKALGDGEIGEKELDEKLRKKMEALGNGNMLKVKEYEEGGVVGKGIGLLNSLDINNGGLLRGPSHAMGGIGINSAEGGEFIINREATSKSLSTLTRINDGSLNDTNIRSLEPMGKQMRVKEGNSQLANPIPQPVKIEPININISGTIKLDGGNGQMFDISKEMMNNPTFISKLTDMITKQININENDGFNKKAYSQRYPNV